MLPSICMGSAGWKLLLLLGVAPRSHKFSLPICCSFRWSFTHDSICNVILPIWLLVESIAQNRTEHGP